MAIATKTYPTQNECRLLFRYLPKGRLEWNPRPAHWFPSLRQCLDWNIKYARTEAGSLKFGYSRIHMGGGDYFEHRLVWVYHNGTVPDGLEIDHIDGDRSNNRIDNLRTVTRQVNAMNKAMTSANRSGVANVSWNNGRRKWQAVIRAFGTTYRLGHFDSLEEAEGVVVAKRRELGFTQRHGKRA